MAKILLMEDDEAQLSLLYAALDLEGHIVTATRDATEAISEFSNQVFDLVVTDIYVHSEGQVAPSSGISLISRIRSIDREKGTKTPILVISGAVHYPGQEKILDVAKSIGADHSLPKPLKLEKLFRAIEDLLAQNAKS